MDPVDPVDPVDQQQPSPGLTLLAPIGAGVGAVLQALAAHIWPGPATLPSAAALTGLAGLAAGLCLGWQAGRVRSLILGVAVGLASAGNYAVLGVTTSKVAAGAVFLVAVPLLTAVSLTAGLLLAGVRRRAGAPN